MPEIIENEIKLLLSGETQAKFLPNISPEELDNFFSRLNALFLFAGFSISNEKRISNVDRYFDTKDYDFDKSQHSLRVRNDDRGLSYSIKKPHGSGVSIQRRIEIEDLIENETEQNRLENSNFADAIDKHLPDFSGKPVFPSAIIKNDRRQFNAERAGENYKVCLDCIKFLLPNSRVESDIQVELEIEASSSSAHEKIDALKKSILAIFPEFSFSHCSKYSRAVQFLLPYKTNLIQKIVKFIKDKPVISAIIAILGGMAALLSIANSVMRLIFN